MSDETFQDRFNRLTADLSDSDLARILDMSVWGVRKLRQGETKTLKFDGALRLCRRLGISPWALTGEQPPVSAMTAPQVGHSAEIDVLRADLRDLWSLYTAEQDRAMQSRLDIIALQRDLGHLNLRVAPLLELAAEGAQRPAGKRARPK